MHGDRTSPQEILATDFSQDFIELMRQQAISRFGEYGSIREHLTEYTPKSCLDGLHEILAEYGQLKNPEALAEAANLMMILYMGEHEQRLAG
jgi:hypothetical protein